MATLTLRVDDADRQALEELARGLDVTVSDLLRAQIDDLLGRSRPVARQGVPQSLSFFERRTLALLHRVLGRQIGLDPTDNGNGEDGGRDDQVQLAKALEEGYVTEYEQEFLAIAPEMPRSEGHLVMDLLDMFTSLGNGLTPDACRELGEPVVRGLTFRGFDQNDPRESRMLYFARDLIQRGRWTNLANHFSAEHDYGDSHAAQLGSYLRMLEVYTPIFKDLIREHIHSGGRTVMSVADLRRIAAARIHPERR